MKKITLLAIAALMTLSIGNLSAQIRSDYRQKVMNWTRTASRIDNRFFTLYTDEAKRITYTVFDITLIRKMHQFFVVDKNNKRWRLYRNLCGIVDFQTFSFV